MSCKIFISHSTTDKEYANYIYDFLVLGLGIPTEDIFCSSIPGSKIPQGEDFNFYILDRLKESSESYTIAVISDAYYNSNYCLYELGAAWGLSKSNASILPFIVEDMHRGAPKDFLRNRQNIVGENIDDISDLKDLFDKNPNVRKNNVATQKFEAEKLKLVQSIKNLNSERQRKKLEAKSPENKNQKIKLVAFDFDGTILQGDDYRHSWVEIWKFLKLDLSIRKELEIKHYNSQNTFKFQDWCNACVEKFKEKGFSRQNVYDIINARKLVLAENFDEVIRVLKAFGMNVIIISGGINTFVEATINDDLMDFIDHVYINNFIYDKDGNLDKVEAYQNEYSDPIGKVKVLENFCAKHDILLSEVAYVGERMNDVEALKVVGRPILYPAKNAHPNLINKYSKFNTVHDGSMVRILPYILD